MPNPNDIDPAIAALRRTDEEEAAFIAEQEAQREAATDPLMQPQLWPMLERPASPRQLGQVILTVARTQAGRLLLNELVVAFLLSEGGTLTAERQQGQTDVVRYLLQHLGMGLNQRGRSPVKDLQAHDTNPWRDDNGRR